MQCFSLTWRFRSRAVSVTAVTLLVATLHDARAYETRTHERLSVAAFNASIMADTTRGPLAALDIDDPQERRFQSIVPPRSLVVDPLLDERLEPVMTSAAGLVGLGSIYEDHPLSDHPFTRHFFDPQQNGRGMVGAGRPSPEWVIEPGGPGSIAEQNFSIADAREFYLQALTLGNRQARERPTILLLQTMGRVVHHLQDMSQPAHSRDDIHPPWDGDEFERHTNNQFFRQDRPLPVGGTCGEAEIDLRVFDRAAKFWSFGGRGIAEFAGFNFVSQDTNFRRSNGVVTTDSVHPQPSFPANPVYEAPTVAELGIQGPIPASSMRFLVLPIRDALSGGGCDNNRAAAMTLSARLSGIIGATIEPPFFQLNRFTYEGNYRILLPRAISYSTGMLNYFFRGRMELVSTGVVNNELQVVVRNASEGEFPFAPASGTGVPEFSVYYDASDGQRHAYTVRNDDLTTGNIAFGETYTLSIPMPADVDPSVQKPFTLIFNGTIGEEPGIAALKIGQTPDSFLVTPNYLPADGIAGTRLIRSSQGAWQLSTTQNARAGNIDWRGHSAEDVLTWDGPQGRYFGASITSPNIFRGGKILSVAPGTVLGVAITRPGERRFLIAAVNAGGAVRIYRRPYQLTYARDGLFNALNNPIGWQLIHSQSMAASSPMFFNASGSEGQVFAGANIRYRLRISGTSVTATQLSNAGAFTITNTSTADRDGEASVDPGPHLSCRARGQACVGPRSSCTLPSGEVRNNVCMVWESREATSSSLTNENRVVRENLTPTIVCADYRGDVEMLCRIEINQTPGGGRQFSGGNWNSMHRTTTNESCGGEHSGPKEYRHSYQQDSSDSFTMHFRIGSLDIPLSGQAHQIAKSYQSSFSQNYADPPSTPEPVVTYTYLHEQTEFDTKLLYVDARNGIVVYEDQRRHGLNAGSGGATSFINSTGELWVFDAMINRDWTITNRVVVQADREYVVSSRTTVEDSSPGTFRENTGIYYNYGSQCDDPPAQTNSVTTRYDWNTATFNSTNVHPRVKVGVTQSLSAISSDLFVASIPIWIRQPNNTYVQEGTWNFLSNGSLGTLLPTAPADAQYVRTGIAR
jgi:hypothetical protein